MNSSSGSPVDQRCADSVWPDAPEHRANATSLRSLIHHQFSVEHDAPLEQVQRLFCERHVDFFALVCRGRVTGICSRLRVGDLLGSRFGFALNSRSPAHLAQVERSLVFTEATPVPDVLNRTLVRRGDEFHEDVVLVGPDHGLLGLVPIDALARLQTRLVSEQVEELRRQQLELFQSNHALRQSRGLYLGLFESHTLGVALLDLEGGLLEHNQRFAQLLDSGVAPGDSLAALVVESERARFLALLQTHARDAQAPASREFTLDIPGRGARLFRCSIGWIRETGQICACLDDITEQRSLERQILRHEKQILLDTLVGGIAHELNNKLTPVQGFAELIGATAAEPTRHFAGLIAASVTEASNIIRQLLQLSNPNTAITRTVDLRALVEEALSLLRFQIRDAQCAVRTAFPVMPVRVRADPSQLKQVVLNLALNALQAMAGRGDATLTVEIAEQNQTATLVVADNGEGIPAENLSRIFDPFFTTKGPEHGTGLGLSICFSIVHQHGGEIDVASQPGAGARFTVSLPLDLAGAPALDLSESPPAAAPDDPPRRGSRVLVVEDEIVVRRLLQEVLCAKFGCEVHFATNGVEALERLARERYALIISDIRMASMNGTEFYLWLREAQPEAARRMLFVTGYAGDKELDAEIAQWGVPVLAKPFTLAELSAACAPFLQLADEPAVA